MTDGAAREEALRFVIQLIDNAESGLEHIEGEDREVVGEQIDHIIEELNDRLHQLQESHS